MTGWLESIVGPDYAAALMWTIVALIVLLVLLILTRIVRGLGVGTFVAGGRNRKARLAVMDATAVDSHRRLVLVRRDDVEHLILIGGPTDVVVEQNIRLIAPARRPIEEDTHQRRAQQPQTQPAARPATPAAPRPEPSAPAAPPSPPPSPIARPEIRAPQAASASTPPPLSIGSAATPGIQRMRPAEAPAHAPRPAPGVQAASMPSRKSEIDEALLHELEVSLDTEAAPAAIPQPPAAARSNLESSLDEEMSKLLSDLAGKR